MISEKSKLHILRLDQVVRACEIKHGLCLGILGKVDKELTAKFERQWESLNEAIREGWDSEIPALADGAVRGVWALEKAVIQAGEAPDTLFPFCEDNTSVEVTPQPKTHIEPLPYAFFKDGGDEIGF